jgi:osmotically-inducible protein OsmY
MEPANSNNKLLNHNLRTDTSSVSVKVAQGVATLQGSVSSLEKKKLAEYNALQVGGVVAVVNQLTVENDGQHSDQGISDYIKDSIQNNQQINSEQIQVEVYNGQVYLNGQADSYLARKKVREIVDHTPGVVKVLSNIMVSNHS